MGKRKARKKYLSTGILVMIFFLIIKRDVGS